jgi:hypothetical protein
MRKKAFARPVLDHIPSERASPAEVKRVFDAALVGIRDASFGSQIGRLHLTNRLSSGEVAAAKRWAEISC